LPQIILLSIALHAGGLLVLFSHLRPPENSVSLGLEAAPPNLSLLLRSEETPDSPLTAIAAPTSENRGGKVSASLPVLAGKLALASSAANDKTATPAATAPALALKDRMNAHVRLPEDSITPSALAPNLNSHQGIVFILDISGSMYEAFRGTTRLAVARQLMAERIRALQDGIPFAIVVYGERALENGPLVPANPATRAAAVQFIARDYDCGGGTDLTAGLDLAENLNTGRLLLITDGDLNMSAEELLPRIRRILGAQDQGPAFTVLGVSPRSNTHDGDLLQRIADQQGGTYQVASLVERASLLTSTRTDSAAP
jgi:Mg-chelatase subunit ChlD